MVDPDVAPASHIKTTASKARALFQQRKNHLAARLKTLLAAPRTPAGFDQLLLHVDLGVPTPGLQALAAERDRGLNIGGRLEQLSLTLETFDRLLRISELVAGSAPVEDSDWDDACAILLQVEKQRGFAAWRLEEARDNVSLRPELFEIPEPPPPTFLPPPPEQLPAWRATWRDRQAWEDTLESRREQQEAVIAALREAVSATEEDTLPLLRDALLDATDAPGWDRPARAKWFTDRLLIDAANGGCQLTTRIAQAIETVQGLLWSLRTGQLQDTYPHLTLEADHFDEEWKWIGSYATWRAAMLVFLYPENVLAPTLRKHQTPAFRAIVDDLRERGQLTLADAEAAAARYEQYLQDVASLRVEVSCEATPRQDGLPAALPFLYSFGRSTPTNRVYWSSYDPSDPTGYADSFWQEVPGLGDAAINLIGAVPGPAQPDRRLIYLFARVLEKSAEKLIFTRYDLDSGQWDATPSELDLPSAADLSGPADATAAPSSGDEQQPVTFTAVIGQSATDTSRPHLAIRLPNGAICDRELNETGTDWSTRDWRLLLSDTGGQAYSTLHAMIHIADGFSLFASDANKQISYCYYPGSTPLRPPPPTITTTETRVKIASGPGGCLRGAGILELFVIGEDHRLWHRQYSGTWSDWKALNDAPRSGSFQGLAPAAVSWGNDRVDVFVLAEEKSGNSIAASWLVHGWFLEQAGSWSWEETYLKDDGAVGWYSIAACSWGAGNLDVFLCSRMGMVVRGEYRLSTPHWMYSFVGFKWKLNADPSLRLPGPARLTALSR